MYTNELVTKSISSYQIPDKYRAEAEKLLLETIALFGEDGLLLVAITGSCALEFCIDGWSDINVLIVTKELDQEKNKFYYKICGNHSIFITPTLLTQKEFENNNFSDDARVAIWQLKEKMIKPNYLRGVMSIPNITLKDIQDNDRITMPIKVQILKELLWQNIPNSKEILVKTLYTIVKIALRKRGIITYSYSGAFDKFAKEYNAPGFDIFFELVLNSSPSEQFLDYAKNVLKIICRQNI